VAHCPHNEGNRTSITLLSKMRGVPVVELRTDNREQRAGAFFGAVAGVLVLALTAMAFNALDAPRASHAVNWEVSLPEHPAPVAPSFGS
jgi:hypothetical protein